MLPRLVGGANAVPVGLREPLGHLFGRSEQLRLPRRRGRTERDGEKKKERGGEQADEFHDNWTKVEVRRLQANATVYLAKVAQGGKHTV
jgi:hypothetical protein